MQDDYNYDGDDSDDDHRQTVTCIPDRCRSGFENEGPPVLRIRMNEFAHGGEIQDVPVHA